MIIEKKEFNKLKVFDRIEFRQKYILIKEDLIQGIIFFGIIYSTFLTALIISILENFYIFMAFGLITITVDIIFSISLTKQYNNKIKELEKEYFKVEVK